MEVLLEASPRRKLEPDLQAALGARHARLLDVADQEDAALRLDHTDADEPEERSAAPSGPAPGRGRRPSNSR